MDINKAKRILNEFNRRSISQIQWFDPEFEAQNNFIKDPAKLKAAQCSRRSGKTMSAGIYLCKEAYENPGVSVLYVALTRDAAKRIFCKDILDVLNRKYNLRMQSNKTELTYTLPNGSVIYLVGADANPTDMDKMLGQKYKLVVVDEAAFYRQDMHKMVYEVLMPGTADYEGTICMISTTSDITQSLYYDITTDKEPGWSVHRWTASQNPYMREKWQNEIARLRKMNPNVDDLPRFKRMYLNQWYVDSESLVYKYNDLLHGIDALPEKKNWNYVLGIDLGWNDATAFTVGCYVDYEPTLYIIDTYKQTNMFISPKEGVEDPPDKPSISTKIKKLEEQYGQFDAIVIDHNKQIVEELRSRHGFDLTNAEKTDKRGAIELFNADLIMGRTKLLRYGTEGLRQEYSNLIWDPRKLQLGKYEEYAGVDNHLTDSATYMWRYCYNHAFTPLVDKPDPHSEEAIDHFFEREAALIEKRRNMDQIELDWEDDDEDLTMGFDEW